MCVCVFNKWVKDKTFLVMFSTNVNMKITLFHMNSLIRSLILGCIGHSVSGFGVRVLPGAVLASVLLGRVDSRSQAQQLLLRGSVALWHVVS